MSTPNFSIVYSARPVMGTTIEIGDCLVPNDSGLWVVATSANRTSYGRARAVALTATSPTSVSAIQIQKVGDLDASISGLASGSAQWVRVSSLGRLERVGSPSGSDDLIGKSFANGDVQLSPGVWDSDNYAGGGGGGGGDASYPIDLADGAEVTGTLAVANGGIGSTSAGSSGQFLKSNGTVFAPASLATSDVASGTFVHERGGLEADVSAYHGLVKISGGSTSDVSLPLAASNGGTGLSSLGSGVATWLGTPSGANLASALSSALPNTKGGTGQDSSGWTGLASVSSGTWSALTLGSGVATWLGTPSGANLASALTTALPTSKGGTGVDMSASNGLVKAVSAGSWTTVTLGTGVETFLATPSSANLISAVTDETGTGSLVFGTSPTISSPTLSGTPVFSATDLQATGNARGKVYSNISSVQTTDGTVTSLYTWTILDEAVTLATAEVGADRSTGADTAAYVRRVKFKRDGGTVTAGTTETTFTDESVSGWDCTIDNSTSTGRVRVTGASSTTIDWAGITTRFEVAHA